ncbi:MAG: ATP-binding protein [Candidatus Binatia bacterium]
MATNTFKHAFHDRDNGEIEIKLQTVPQGEIRLRFADNGRGFAAPSSWESVDTLGLRLLRMLTRQLGGQIEMRSDRGTTVELSFKIDPARDSPGANQPRVSS